MIATAPAPTAVEPREHYLNAGYGVKSWLLTTDHKRIALLYLASITLFFVLGGAFAVMVRLELVTPEGDLMRSETYNKMFTMHGLVMVFFFLIPSIPAVLGNFLLPIMIGARDLAFPRLNLAVGTSTPWAGFLLSERQPPVVSIPAGLFTPPIAVPTPTVPSSPRPSECLSSAFRRF